MILTRLAITFLLLSCFIGWRMMAAPFPQQPLTAYQSEQNKSQIDQCADCHSSLVEAYRAAPHANTLARAEQFEFWDRFLNKKYQPQGTELEYEFRENDETYELACRTTGQSAQVDWIFGSGHHAQTPLGLLEDVNGKSAMFELAVSWYPEHGLGATLGQESHVESGRLLGNFHTGSVTEECFACHSSFLHYEDQVLDPHQIIEGIGCVRCHFDSEEHIARQNEGESLQIESLSKITATELNLRCGECHRHADEIPPQDLVPSNEMLIRFAPVGFSLSACFQQDGVETGFRCTDCHDPHRRDVRTDVEYSMVCLKCHQPEHEELSFCTVAADTDANCISCHMPKVETQPPLKFTDHWIRNPNTK